MNENSFPFEQAKVFSNLVEQEKEEPMLHVLDRDFLDQYSGVNAKVKRLFDNFPSQHVQKFMRYRNSSLFIINRSIEIPVGYLLNTSKHYNLIPRLDDHFEVLNRVIINIEWNKVELKRLNLD